MESRIADGRGRKERERERGRERRNEGMKRKLGKDVRKADKGGREKGRKTERKATGEEDVLDGRKGSSIQEIQRKGGERCGQERGRDQ